MRSGVGAACPLTFLVLRCLEFLEAVVWPLLVLPADFVVVEVLAPELLIAACLCVVFLDCDVLLLCAAATGTINVPAVNAANSSPPRFLLQSNCRIVFETSLFYLLSAGTTPGRKTVMTRSVGLRRITLKTTFSPGLSLLIARR